MFFNDIEGSVRGTAVDNHQLLLTVGLRNNALQTGTQRVHIVKDRYDY